MRTSPVQFGAKVMISKFVINGQDASHDRAELGREALDDFLLKPSLDRKGMLKHLRQIDPSLRNNPYITTIRCNEPDQVALLTGKDAKTVFAEKLISKTINIINRRKLLPNADPFLAGVISQLEASQERTDKIFQAIKPHVKSVEVHMDMDLLPEGEPTVPEALLLESIFSPKTAKIKNVRIC